MFSKRISGLEEAMRIRRYVSCLINCIFVWKLKMVVFMVDLIVKQATRASK